MNRFCVYFLIITFVFAALPTAVRGDINDGRVGYWMLDEGAGTTVYDSSGYHNDGILVNGPTWASGVPGLGGAIDFPATATYAEIPDNISLKIAGPFTVMCWIYPRNLQAGGETIVSKHPNYWIQFDGIGKRNFRGGFRDNVTWDLHAVKSPDMALSLYQWQHIATVWDGDSLKLYLNGTQIAATWQGPVVPDTSRGPQIWEDVLNIGAELSVTQYFDGLIDQVKIYARALAPSDIRLHYREACGCGDSDCNGFVNISDAVYLIAYIFGGGPAPCAACK